MPSLAQMGKDLLLTPLFEADEWETLDLVLNPPAPMYLDERVDLARTDGARNLQQALILRLLTPVGSLSGLGHAEYGSRLSELIGGEDSKALRQRARVYVLQAIAQERRVGKVLALDIAPATADARDRLRIGVSVEPVAGGDPIHLGLEVGL